MANRFLADASCDFEIVRALRGAGHDVTAIAEISPQEPDPSILSIANQENRILITQDKDFGELVYLEGLATAGVIFLVRDMHKAPQVVCRQLVELAAQSERLTNQFIVVLPDHVRFGSARKSQ